ncbi:hypothetical protein [Mycobacterium paraseoulense]|uniref:hypothetical protein n=1 Tax=Mycobacterium paraseoulense TaxID=590652 RepID=UPI0013D85C5D|nr:hypothetical protein [Mycobacterium paraseoulense]
MISRPLLLPVAWANILLHRTQATEAALDRFTAALARADLPEARRAELTLEANVVRAVAEIYADRIDGLEDLLAEVMSRAQELRPVLPGRRHRPGVRGDSPLRPPGRAAAGGSSPSTSRSARSARSTPAAGRASPPASSSTFRSRCAVSGRRSRPGPRRGPTRMRPDRGRGTR